MPQKGGRFSARTRLMAFGAAALVLGGCSVGPKYQPPSITAPAAYKEPTAQTIYETEPWKIAQPEETTIAGKWWELFGDPELNALEEQVNVSNQSVASAAAGFLMARALVKEARSAYFPTVTTNPSIVESQPSPGQFGGFGGGTPSALSSFTNYSLPFDASWQPDFWGRVQNTVKSDLFAAQASAADLENIRLTAQAEVAADYFELRTQDALKQLFDATVAAYQDSLDVTQTQFRAGIASDEAVAQAETQLRATQAQDTNLGIEPRAVRARSGGFGRAAGVGIFAPGESPECQSAVHSVRGAGATAGAPSGRRPGRAAHGSGQRADWPGARGVLSQCDAKRGGGLGGHHHRKLVHLAQPLLVRGAGAGGDAT